MMNPTSTSSAKLLIFFLLSISFGTWGESIPSETEKSALDAPTCSSDGSNGSKMTNSPFFDTFLDAYRETVDTIVDLQTTTWNYLDRYKFFDESTVEGMCEGNNRAHLYTNIPKFEQALKKEATNQESHTATTTKPSISSGIPAGFKHDRESDIDRYLNELVEGCSKDIVNATDADTYVMECLERLRSIVFDPRCTTRYDSRVECNGEALPSELSSPSELIANHFGSSASDQDALHVVIVGTGPIGLMLGNSLSMLPAKSHREGGSSIPPIKILYLETRADAPGVKRPYTRNWQAQLSLLHFRDRLDPRVYKILGAMSTQKDNLDTAIWGFTSPLNVIETLLLLSNRDLGASKFLFGVNPLDVVEDLKKVPNLVLVDATGHRLEPMRRGPVCDGKGDDYGDATCTKEVEEETIILNHRTPPPPESFRWNNSHTSDFYEYNPTFKENFTGWHEILEEHGQHLHVGKSGDIMYPIDEKTKKAKAMMWLDIHGAMPLGEKGKEKEFRAQTDSLYAKDGPFCTWCYEWWAEMGEDFVPANQEEESNNDICGTFCYTHYLAQSTSLLRRDIVVNLFNGRFKETFVYHSDSWFPLTGYSFNPSPKLAGVVEKVLVANGFGRHPTGMPLSEFFPALIRGIRYGVFSDEDDYEEFDDDEYDDDDEYFTINDSWGLSDEDWDLIEAIGRYTYQSNTTKWPTVSLYSQRPFIYTNGIKKKIRCSSSTNIGDHLEHAPMLRFGDSFTTGDGLNGAGFFTHATMIGIFMDLILEKCSGISSPEPS